MIDTHCKGALHQIMVFVTKMEENSFSLDSGLHHRLIVSHS
jgi:hypothetical protein